MTGGALGSPWGNAQILAVSARVKQNVDSGVFQAVQYAGHRALTGSQQCVADNCRIWQERGTSSSARSATWGSPWRRPERRSYAWVPVPRGFTSGSFCVELLVKAVWW